jgi:predicted N-acyltransferase
MIAERAGQPVAASFFLRDADALYGRYWGAVEYIPCLHFEACYYQAIAYAIAEGLSRFEGGAQGEHKLSRGLEPVRTTSAHWIADPRFADAVADFLARARRRRGLPRRTLRAPALPRRRFTARRRRNFALNQGSAFRLAEDRLWPCPAAPAVL